MRFVRVVLAMLGSILLAAIALVVVDLYLTGHGMRGLMGRPLLHSLGAQLSVADGIALTIAIIAGSVAAFWKPRRG
ncbi:MAG: hypothetical protein ACYC3L_03760 [Gemmatimonadaceae bacterium]